MGHTRDIVTATAASLVSLATGHRMIAQAQTPPETLVLYEFEACPFCRRVREAFSALALDALIMPCPKGGRHRAEATALGGKAQFPFLHDKNSGKALYESEAIADYVAHRYARGQRPWQHKAQGLAQWASKTASGLRPGRGLIARGHKQPKKPLDLYSFEASPFCRLVREVLSELELPYVLHNLPRGSAKRHAFVAMSGKMQVPFLNDDNTGRSLFESRDIIAYLEETYGN